MTSQRQTAAPGSYVIGMDLGGTKILAAVVDEAGQIIAQAKAKTRARKGPDVGIERMADAARQAAKKAGIIWSEVAGMGLGAPGPIDPIEGVVHNPPNLPGWVDVPLAPLLSKELGIPVWLENDVNLGTLGESAMGAGQGTQDMVGIFVGTGVGGGIILGGSLHSGAHYAAAEVGHMIVLADGPVCGCGKRGCLEALASRKAIERDIRLGIAAGRESIIPSLVKPDERMTSGVLLKAVRRGDPLVTEVIERAQWYLGLHAATIVNLIDPEMIVFGGGVVEAFGEEFLGPIRTTAQQYFMLPDGSDKVQIVAATLGDHSAILGAAVLARQKSAT